MAETMSELAGAGVKGLQSHSPPAQVVEQFLELLCASDVERAMDLLAAEVKYENVGLPTVHGRERVRQLFRATLARSSSGFEAYVHTIATNGSTVLTERTDVLKIRRLHIALWVCGRFDVHDGQIVLWRDYFDQMNIAAGFARGLLGTVIPAARAKPPAN